MSISIVQLVTPRAVDEGLRIGTVRRPPRGVPKAEFASCDYYDTWLPLLAALSHGSQFAVGCYCENEARCHRSLLRQLLAERGAALEAEDL
ncbi:hypothetical protein D3C76_872410 [compost metagenome]